MLITLASRLPAVVKFMLACAEAPRPSCLVEMAGTVTLARGIVELHRSWVEFLARRGVEMARARAVSGARNVEMARARAMSGARNVEMARARAVSKARIVEIARARAVL